MAASGPARDKGRVAGNGQVPANGLREDVRVRDNDLLAPGQGPANGPRVDEAATHWEILGPAGEQIGCRREAAPALAVVVAAAFEQAAAAVVAASAVAAVAVAAVAEAVVAVAAVDDGPISTTSTISFFSAIFPTAWATTVSATTAAIVRTSA